MGKILKICGGVLVAFSVNLSVGEEEETQARRVGLWGHNVHHARFPGPAGGPVLLLGADSAWRRSHRSGSDRDWGGALGDGRGRMRTTPPQIYALLLQNLEKAQRRVRASAAASVPGL